MPDLIGHLKIIEMKSYLRFLSRNKVYTAIEVVGLSLALAFVIVLSSYIVDDMSVNKVLKDTDDVYLCHREGTPTIFDEIPQLYGMMPQIEESCSIFQSGRRKTLFDGITTATAGDRSSDVSVMGASDTFFNIFTFRLSEGNPEDVLELKNSVVISESLAAMLFPDGAALGKEINVFEKNPYSDHYSDFADFNVNLVVTGIFKPFGRSIFIEPDMIMRHDLVNEQMFAMFHGSMRIGEMSFVRLAEGTDRKALLESISTEFNKVAKNYSEKMSRLIAFIWPKNL